MARIACGPIRCTSSTLSLAQAERSAPSVLIPAPSSRWTRPPSQGSRSPTGVLSSSGRRSSRAGSTPALQSASCGGTWRNPSPVSFSAVSTSRSSARPKHSIRASRLTQRPDRQPARTQPSFQGSRRKAQAAYRGDLGTRQKPLLRAPKPRSPHSNTSKRLRRLESGRAFVDACCPPIAHPVRRDDACLRFASLPVFAELGRWAPGDSARHQGTHDANHPHDGHPSRQAEELG